MQNQGIGPWVARHAHKSRGDVAIISSQGELRYEQFAERIERLADGLAARGIRNGDRVAYLGENHPDLLTTLFACSTLGAIFVPLNTRLAARELQFMLEDCEASMLVVHDSLRELGRSAAWGTPVSRRIVVDGPAEAPAVEAFDEVIAAGRPFLRDVPIGLDDAAVVLYTSGTTGHPKGAILTHGNLIWNCINVLVDTDVTSDEVALLIAPLFHTASLGMGALPTILKGGTLVLQEKFEPGAVLAAIQHHRVTSLSGVPTTFQMLSEHPDWEATDISSLRKLTCGGSSVPLRMIDAYEKRGLSFASGYGMTETSPGVTNLPYRKAREHVGTSGLPHFFTDVRIVAEDGTPAATGVAGEIQVSGPNVIPGYWNRPDATRDLFDGEWLRTGDIGWIDGDGYLTVTDRLKDMIISGGENIYPVEIEQQVMGLTEISAVAVIGVPDDRWGEVPLAVAVRAEGATIDGDRIIDYLRGRLAKYKIPKNVVFVDELPRTASGKVRKVELRRAYSGLT